MEWPIFDNMAHRKNTIMMEFHISRKARDLYQFDESLFSISGNVIFPNFHAARLFAQKINEKRKKKIIVNIYIKKIIILFFMLKKKKKILKKKTRGFVLLL